MVIIDPTFPCLITLHAMSENIPPTPFEDLDAAVAAVRAAKDTFARLPIADRMNLIDRCIDGLSDAQDGWFAAACKAKRLDPNTSVAGEEWLGGPMVTQGNLRLLRQSLMDVRDYGTPQLPEGSVSTSVSGQTVVRAFPTSTWDKLLFQGFTGEIWMEPGVTPEGLADTQAVVYKDEAPEGKVALVLGAGNVSSIGPMDVLYKLFAENEVCVLKMNPVNEYVGPFIEQAFACLVEADFLRVVYGGAEVGDYLCKHDGIDTIHITGSDKTHDIIVWGPPGEERDRRMADDDPVNPKPITSELGCVTPVVIVPGEWKPADLAFQAENVAAMVANNGSFNCNAAKMLVLHAGWKQKPPFMKAVAEALRNTPRRYAYYPGAQQQYDKFLAAHPEANPVGARTDDVVPWTLIEGVDPNDPDELCFTMEAFCGVLGQTALEAEDTADFIQKAVDFCNDTMWGTLSCSMIVHPKTQKAHADAIERAIADLRYGTVAVNHWAALAYGFCSTTWGAFPGHSMKDIQSGIGVVHNTYLFDKPQKTVVRGPFRVAPKPTWFASNKRTHKIAPLIAEFEASPSVLKLPGIVFNSLLG